METFLATFHSDMHGTDTRTFEHLRHQGAAAAAIKSPAVKAPAPAKAPKKVVSKSKIAAAAPAKVSAADFIFTKVLGRGSFGKVFLAEKRGCDDVFAIKCLKKTSVVEDDDVLGTMTEKRVLSQSGGSPFLTRLHATFQTDAQLYFVMEFVNGGDLMYVSQTCPVMSANFLTLGVWVLVNCETGTISNSSEFSRWTSLGSMLERFSLGCGSCMRTESCTVISSWTMSCLTTVGILRSPISACARRRSLVPPRPQRSVVLRVTLPQKLSMRLRKSCASLSG